MNHYDRCDYKNDSQIICSKFSPYSNSFISFNQHNLLLWSQENFNPIQSIYNDTQVSCFEFGNQENTILQGTKQGKIVILSLEKQINQERQANHKGGVTILTNYDVNTFMSGSLDAEILIHDLRQNMPIAQIQQHKKAISDIVTDKDSFRFICSSQDATISIWDFRNHSQLQVLFNNQDSVSSLLLVKNQNALFTSDEKFTIKQWDINEQSQNQVSQFEQPILKMAFDYQEEVLICASQNNLDLLNIQLLHLNTIEINWSNVQDIKFKEDFVQVLEERGDTLSLHQFQLELDIQQTENSQILFPISLQFDQCFYPSQPRKDLDQSLEVSNTIITTENFSLQFSQLLYTKFNQEKYKQLEIIQEISSNHIIIQIHLNDRISKLKPIINLYSINEIKQCIQLLCQSNDCSIFIDFFSFLRLNTYRRKLQMEDIALLLENVNKLLNSKISAYIFQGLEFIKFCFDQFRDNRIQYKNEKTQLQKKPFLDRQLQKQKVFEKLMLQFDKIIKLPNFCRVLKAKDDKLANLTRQIITEISQFLNKLK